MVEDIVTSDMADTPTVTDRRAAQGTRRTFFVTFLVLLLSVAVFSLWMVAPYIVAIFVGAILAILARPLFKWIVRHARWNSLGALLVTLAVALLVVAPLTVLTVLAAQQTEEIARWGAANGKSEFSVAHLISWVHQLPWLHTLLPDPRVIDANIHKAVEVGVNKTVGLVGELLTVVPELVIQLFLALLTCYYLLMDGNRFSAWLLRRVPLEDDVRADFAETFLDSTVSVVWASLAAALAQSAVVTAGFAVLGVPGVALAAVATFVFSWIPVVGSSPVWLVGAAVLFWNGSGIRCACMLGIGVLAIIIDHVVRPLVLRGRGDLHPLVGLVAIFGGINAFGLVGVFLGPILASLFLSLLRMWPVIGRRAGVAFDSTSAGAQATRQQS